jgi:hypothetical protein
MQIMRTARPAKERADVKMWHCGGCGVVHMSVGKMVLNLGREEFAELTEAVLDLSTSGWLDGKRSYSIIDLVASDGDTVH